MRRILRIIRHAIVIAALAGTGALASAQVAAADPGGNATFRGGKIDLTKGWGDATACVIFSPADVRCYTTYGEANLASSKTGGAALLGTANCPGGWVCIYEGTNWDGRRLQFSDDYWQSLAPYGFERQASSWHNNQDCAWWQGKRDNATLGNGSGWNLDLPACARSSSIGSYDNVAVDIHG